MITRTSSLLRVAGILFAACALSRGVAAETPAAKPDSVLVRGEYLVHRSGMCVDCHSPRDEKGQFIESKHLTGSVLAFAATVPMPWAPAAPSLVGLDGYTKEQGVKFLMTGERPAGVPPRPPMPAYRFNAEDAQAIVAYLKSLKKTEVASATH